MKQAVPNVCLALSDDEDYVSFDEDDLNAGIQDLYDNDSAEDAASDISNEEYFDLNPAEVHSTPAIQSLSKQRTPSPPIPTHRLNIPSPFVLQNNNPIPSITTHRQRRSQTVTSLNNNHKHHHLRAGRGRAHRTRRSVSKTDDDLINMMPSPSRHRSTTPEAPIAPKRRKLHTKNEDLFESLNQINIAPKPLQNKNRRSLNANAPVYSAIPRPPMPQIPRAPMPVRNRAMPPPPMPFAPMLFAPIPAPMPPRAPIYIPNPYIPGPPPPPTGNHSISQLSAAAPPPLPPPPSAFSIAPPGSELSFAAPQSASAMNTSRKSVKLSKRIQKLNEMKERKKRKHRKIIHKQKINTNVISVDLGTLKESAQNIATGDPVRCRNKECGSILSKYDKLLAADDDIKLDDDDERIWICRFCCEKNIIEIDDEEMPSDETVDYIIEPPDDHKQKDVNCEEEKQIIFCIDISGSMCVTQAVHGKKFDLKGDRLKKENDELSQFIDPMDRNQWMPHQSQNVTYISRLQSVAAAVDEQIMKIKESNPNTKVGLVTFNNEVTVYGDGMSNNEIITGDKLDNLNKLKEIGGSDECAIKHCIAESHANLSDTLWNLEEKGQTALGPALSVSIAIGAVKRGSQVILCTDGLANIGVGNMDDNANTENINRFYSDLGNWAMEHGVVVSIISITDDGCSLEALGRIVQVTNGNLRRINPLKLTEKFSGILDKEIIATKTTAKMLLHRGLKFVDTVSVLQNINPFEDDKDKDKDKDKEGNNKDFNKDCMVPSSQQDIGNVFGDTTIFFEYGLNRDVIKNKNDFCDVKHLPFQVHISYNKLDGTAMLRVITQQKEVTYDKEKIRSNLDYSVLSKYGTRITTKLCDVGDYEASRAFTNANTRYMHRHSRNSVQINNLAGYVNSNIGLDYQMQQQQMQEINNYNNTHSYNNSYSPAMNRSNNNWIARGVQMTSNNNNINVSAPPPAPQSSHFQAATPQQNLQQQTMRRGQRSDKFSSLQYGMKRKF